MKGADQTYTGRNFSESVADFTIRSGSRDCSCRRSSESAALLQQAALTSSSISSGGASESQVQGCSFGRASDRSAKADGLGPVASLQSRAWVKSVERGIEVRAAASASHVSTGIGDSFQLSHIAARAHDTPRPINHAHAPLRRLTVRRRNCCIASWGSRLPHEATC